MNFVTKNLISDLKEILELKKLIKDGVISSDNTARILEFLDHVIDQSIKDIMHTEKL